MLDDVLDNNIMPLSKHRHKTGVTGDKIKVCQKPALISRLQKQASKQIDVQ